MVRNQPFLHFNMVFLAIQGFFFSDFSYFDVDIFALCFYLFLINFCLFKFKSCYTMTNQNFA